MTNENKITELEIEIAELEDHLKVDPNDSEMLNDLYIVQAHLAVLKHIKSLKDRKYQLIHHVVTENKGEMIKCYDEVLKTLE